MTRIAIPSRHRWLVRTEGWAVVTAMAVSAGLVAVAAVVAGPSGALSAALGAGDVMVFFAAGSVVDAWALRRVNWSGGAIVLAGYGARITLLTVVAVWLASTPWLNSATWFAAGAVAATLAWPAGLIVGHATGRWPVYDNEIAVGVPA